MAQRLQARAAEAWGKRVESHHPDADRWNARYARVDQPKFSPHPLLAAAEEAGIPDGPVIELACGMSGNALALAEAGRNVIAVDVSDVALDRLAEEARRRGLAGRITCVQADLTRWTPPPGAFSLVMCIHYWSAAVFSRASTTVAPGGLLAWEAHVRSETHRSHVRAEWCLTAGQPASLLPTGFKLVSQLDIEQGVEQSRRTVARRQPDSPPEAPAQGD